MVDDAVKRGAKPLPSEVRQPKEYWAYLCSMEKNALIVASNILDTPEYTKLNKKGKDRVWKEVERHIKLYKVPALFPKQVVEVAGPSDVRYVQIDVEGLDNEVVSGLPWGLDGFWPEVVIWENHNGVKVK